MTDNNVHNLNQLKKARLYAEHVEAIIKVIDLSLKGLKHFEPYTSVARIMQVLNEERKVLQDHLDKCKKIKETKGKINA